MALIPKAWVIVKVPPGVVLVPCLRSEAATTPLVPTLAEVVDNTLCQLPPESCQAMTVAYDPCAWTVTTWVAFATLTGTGKRNLAGAVVFLAVACGAGFGFAGVVAGDGVAETDGDGVALSWPVEGAAEGVV